MLEAKDVNLLCDVIRTLGQLGSRKAGGRILALAGHEDWTVRNVALVALGSIDIYTYVKALEKGLGDKEWWVRYNSAKALCAYEYIEEVQASVARTDDRFAKEILTYVIAENEIYKKAGAVGIVRV